MKNLHKTLIQYLFGIYIAFFPFFILTTPVHAQQEWRQINTVCVGPSTVGNAYKTSDGKGASDVATIGGVECLISQVLATAITLLGIIAFIMFLVGGFRFLTAGSNSKGVEAGKGAISFAILGIIVALASFLMLKTLATITGVTTIMDFRVQQLPPS